VPRSYLELLDGLNAHLVITNYHTFEPRTRLIPDPVHLPEPTLPPDLHARETPKRPKLGTSGR
jgi:hypothetical protein